ncbi:uracil-DNA glycosylase [bacterium]|nr:uracil-DNA glycosylase [bacterium]
MTESAVDVWTSKAEAYLAQQRDLGGPELYGLALALPALGLRGPAPSPAGGRLEAFRIEIGDCRKCGLAASRTHLVFGAGNPDARLMIVGEAPGEEEDRRGEPFVGEAGRLLDRILNAVGFDREEVYIANVLKCRPPRNRDPLPEETALCLPYLEGQIDRIQPRLILALGRFAAQSLLSCADPLSRLRGAVQERNGVPVIATYHPAALLRNPEWKRPTWEDVQRLRKLYDERVGDKPAWNPSA